MCTGAKIKLDICRVILCNCEATERIFGMICGNFTIFFSFFFQQFVAKIALDRRGSHGWTRVLLKGQMRYIADIDAIVFLCSPL